MKFLASLILGIALAILPRAALAEEPAFSHYGVSKDAERYEAYVKETWKKPGKTSPDLRLAADKLMSEDPRAASRSYAEAAAADAKSPEAWLGLAKALLAIKPDPDKSENYDLPVNASGAAYRAYELSKDKAFKARALGVLGEAMQRRNYWRPAIDALKTSLALADDASVREAFEKLRAEHGFRMTDYSTDQNATTPRICVQFSENLSRGQVDFAKFVSVDGKDPQSVTTDGTQLCIDGVEHGKRYEVQIRAGLPSDVREDLEKPIAIAVYIPDRTPTVHFTGKSYVLPSRGQQGIPVVSVNTDKVEVEVYRIGDRSLANALNEGNFNRQLEGYEISTLRERTGAEVYKGILDVTTKLNEEITTAFPVSDAIGQLQPGAYVMVARPAGVSTEDYVARATQWFIVSDMGLTAFSGSDGIHAFVRSLASANPLSGASVRLVARNNEILATAKTDANGYLRFEPGVTRGQGGMQPAILVAENGTGEYAFLDLQANAFDLSDRGVAGRDDPGPIDGYLYTERGVYRPGEDVNVTALTRDSAGIATMLPTTLIVLRPDGVEYGRFTLKDADGLGGRSLNLKLAGDVMTGTWRATLHADPKDPPITQATFLVEDYVPERLDMTLKDGKGTLAPEDTKTIDLAGRYLYGPPAANLSVEGDIVVKEAKTGLAAFPGYAFGLADEAVSPVREALEDLPETNEAGIAEIPVKLPSITKTARPLEANIILRLREDGGRTIERQITLPVVSRDPRIGVKPLFEGGSVGEGETANFDVISLGADANRRATKLDWQLFRLDTSWQWYSRNNTWSYEAQTLTKKVAGGALETTADAAAKITAPVTYGRYRLEVSAPDGSGALTSVVFNAGWYTSGDDIDSPETLDVALDKETYKAGDTAKLRIASKSGGKALVAVLGSSLYTMKEVDLPKGGGDVDITVGSDWGPGAYATALLYRPMDEREKRMPSRAIGVRWIGVDQKDRTLKVQLPTEAKIKSATTLTVPVKIDGLTAGEDARVTVAAVDVGILNLTRYQVPAPELHFYAQRKLATELRDFYGRLIDGMRAERGKLRSGGDGMDSASLNGSPPVEETVAFYSGIVKVGADGTANVEFAMPNFNGTVRVMAVAWSKDKLGHATSDVIVRDAVALTASAPRFLTLGDTAHFDIALHNVDGQAGSYKATVTDTVAAKSLAATDIALAQGERKSTVVDVKPDDVGQRSYDVTVEGPGGLTVSRRLTFDVMPPAGDIKRTTVSQIAGKGGKLTISKDLLAGLIKSRTRVNVSVGPAAQFDVPGLLTTLDRYPHGCAEQTVSRALPLLYANAVASQVGLGQDKELKVRIQAAIDRVFQMQDASGAFGLWGPSNGELWLSSYVTDFLTRAKEQGFDVRALALNQALDRLQNFALNGEDFKSGGEERAYALYVLARNGRAPVGELRYYADTRLDRFTTPLAKAQLGAALAMVGDKVRAETAFKDALASFDKSDTPLARSDYGSNVRDGAALITLASETGIVKTEQPRLVNVVAKAFTSRTYTSTQEQAWMVLAAHALGEQTKQTKLLVGGAPVNGSVARALSADEVEKGLVITNDGDTATDAVVTVIGAALTPEPPISKGFKIVREFYTLDGTKLDLASAEGGKSELKQNDRLVVVVKIDSDESHGRVLLVDRLPAGLEIENPRLVDSGNIKTLDWLKSEINPEHTEFRDDRFVAGFNLSGKSSRSNNNEESEATETEGTDDNDASRDTSTEGAATTDAAKAPEASAMVAYIVRAVTPGVFVHPAATIEDMYRPERYARSGSGTLTVTASK